jgi:Spy/CpxP family protein refolding chaperone
MTNKIEPMKKMILRIAAVVPLIIAMLAMVGCASSSSNGVLTLKQTKINVDWKMTAYQNALARGGITEGQRQQVAATYQAYQQAFQQALTDAGGNLGAPTPPKVQAAADEFIAAVNNVLSTMI